MKTVILSALVLFSACATTPRAMPPELNAANRLAQMEKILLEANDLSMTFEIDSRGENAAHMAGALDLVSGNALKVNAEGNFRGEGVQLELDSRDGESIHRSSTRGANVSSHRDPPAPKLRESIAVSIARMGLLHSLVKVTLDAQPEKVEGGITEWVVAKDAKDGASESINGEPCRRVDAEVVIQGQPMGPTSVCISDRTSLPLQRNYTVHFPTGDMTATETYTWKAK